MGSRFYLNNEHEHDHDHHKDEEDDHDDHDHDDKNHGHSHSNGQHGHIHGRSKSNSRKKINLIHMTVIKILQIFGLIHNPRIAYRIRQTTKKNTRNRNRLLIPIGSCLAFMVVEIVGGVIANSLAIMSDAAHLLSDLAGFFISLFAIILARRAPTSKLSYGFYRLRLLVL